MRFRAFVALHQRRVSLRGVPWPHVRGICVDAAQDDSEHTVSKSNPTEHGPCTCGAVRDGRMNYPIPKMALPAGRAIERSGCESGMDEREAGGVDRLITVLRKERDSGICRVRGIASAGDKANNLRSSEILDRQVLVRSMRP